MEPELDLQDVLETPEEETVAEEEEVTISAEELRKLREDAAKKEELEAKNKQLFERVKKNPPKDTTQGLSPKDILAIRDANVAADDFDEVQEFASFKKITLSEALQHPTMKAILAERAEERRTSQTAAIKSPRGVTKQTGEDLLRRAEATGEVPDTDEGMIALFQARRAQQFRLNTKK